ncbi:MAG: hypothetical protein WBP94_07555 [Rhodomicrobiaceae bacterium]
MIATRKIKKFSLFSSVSQRFPNQLPGPAPLRVQSIGFEGPTSRFITATRRLPQMRLSAMRSGIGAL